ncbi:serpin family protein [Microcoleus sp. FACHB-831]|uniref:serpin family protein n=1 Tax=Microcoleus sp. FACHB-831 TaxID=2692827 RepID=UPI0016879F87|nr:serpin family protein [Microcoleus sp. FACHB-831]MBD1923280.1 serpin family protein [Microcoleus sp. FACHB-831]
MVKPTFIRANTRFAFKLFRELRKEETSKNVFISPASVAIALAMTYNGSVGQTQAEMAIALELQELSLEQINNGNAEVRKALGNLDEGIELAIANSLWAEQDVTFKPDFLQRINDFYKAKVANLNFSAPTSLATINNWVRENTKGKIKTILNQLSPDVALILINAIYFKGIWANPFDKKNTRGRVFTLFDGTQKQHPMMFQSSTYSYYQNESFQAVSLPYGKNRVSMYIFLPNPESNIEEFHKNLNAENWYEWMSQFQNMKGTIVLPRFQLEHEVQLKNALIALGMGMAFEGGFPQMCNDENLAISRVIHKTFLEVNEEGTEAAAATAVMMARSMSLKPTFTMMVDRPFFCAIRDNETGTLLFMGSIMEPKIATSKQ